MKKYNTKTYVKIINNGFFDLHGSCRSADLVEVLNRFGSFGYYMGEPIRVNDLKGYGSILFAAHELEKPILTR